MEGIPYNNNWGSIRYIIPVLKLITLPCYRTTVQGRVFSKSIIFWCFSDRASWIDNILITNLMHWLLFIHRILFSSTCFEPQVLNFRRIQLYTCRIWYCHSLWEFLVACRYTVWVRNNNQCIKLVINIQSIIFVNYNYKIIGVSVCSASHFRFSETFWQWNVGYWKITSNSIALYHVTWK
jgi:hypothetical protein